MCLLLSRLVLTILSSAAQEQLWYNQLDLAGLEKDLMEVCDLAKEPWGCYPWEVQQKACSTALNANLHCAAMLHLVTAEDGLRPRDAAEKQQWEQVRHSK